MKAKIEYGYFDGREAAVQRLAHMTIVHYGDMPTLDDTGCGHVEAIDDRITYWRLPDDEGGATLVKDPQDSMHGEELSSHLSDHRFVNQGKV